MNLTTAGYISNKVDIGIRAIWDLWGNLISWKMIFHAGIYLSRSRNFLNYGCARSALFELNQLHPEIC